MTQKTKKKKEVVARAQPDGEETSMNVTMKVMPPILEENNAYGKKSARKIKEQCKKIGLFRVRVKGMNYEESKNVVHELRQCLYRPSGYIGLQCLSEVDWGKPAEYDDVMKVYDDFICIPKDFDNPKEQLDAILKSAEQKMLEIKKAHNKRCRSLLMEEC